MKILLDLFFSFCRIGAFTFGGGYAVLPMMKREAVEKHGWLCEEEILDYYSVGQCLPGLIAINTSTFIGYRVAGMAGSIAATLGMVFPSVVVILAIASFISNFADYEAVKYAFAGIRVCVAALVLDAVVGIFRKSVVGTKGIAIFGLSLVALMLFSPSPILVVICAGAAGFFIPVKDCGKGDEAAK